MTPNPQKLIKIFYCYARKDKELRDELEKHLAPLKRSGQITTWYDREIPPGTQWEFEIDVHLETADIVLLLISADFMASDYCYNIEMQKALQRHKEGGCCVIPIILRPIHLKNTFINELQQLPSNGKPITTWSNFDEAFESTTKGIYEVIQDIQKLEAERAGKAEEIAKEEQSRRVQEEQKNIVIQQHQQDNISRQRSNQADLDKETKQLQIPTTEEIEQFEETPPEAKSQVKPEKNSSQQRRHRFTKTHAQSDNYTNPNLSTDSTKNEVLYNINIIENAKAAEFPDVSTKFLPKTPDMRRVRQLARQNIIAAKVSNIDDIHGEEWEDNNNVDPDLGYEEQDTPYIHPRYPKVEPIQGARNRIHSAPQNDDEIIISDNESSQTSAARLLRSDYSSPIRRYARSLYDEPSPKTNKFLNDDEGSLQQSNFAIRPLSRRSSRSSSSNLSRPSTGRITKKLPHLSPANTDTPRFSSENLPGRVSYAARKDNNTRRVVKEYKTVGKINRALRALGIISMLMNSFLLILSTASNWDWKIEFALILVSVAAMVFTIWQYNQ